MPTLFNTIFPDEIKLPAQDIQALLDSYRERQKTGIIRLGYPSEKQLCFLFKRGTLINSYLISPEKWESISAEHGAEWLLSAGEAYAKSVSFTCFGLLTTKILLQSTAASTKVLVSHQQLASHLESFSGKNESALLHLMWKNAAGAIFFTPRNDPHVSLVSQDLVLDETGSYKALYEWNEPQCAVTIMPPDLAVEAWQEYYLRSAFANICENSIARFEVLTGRALVDSLVRLVNVFTRRQNMEISITARKLVDNEVFSSPQQTLYAYRLLLAEFFEHFSGIIGTRLYATTLRDIIKNLPGNEYKITRSFELLPKGYFYE